MDKPNSQPQLEELLAGFLARRQTERASDIYASSIAEVEPFDAVPSQSVDARLAWDAATEAVKVLAPGAAKLNKVPTGWANLVANLDSICAMPMAIGCFPQALRDWLPLIRADRLRTTISALRPMSDDPAIASWIDSARQSTDPANWLLAAAVLRLSGRSDVASNLLAEKASVIQTIWRNAFVNEEAATAWFTGDAKTAIAKWTSLPDSAVRSFNLGMAELFSDRPESARTHLKSAIDQLNESSAWHHLSRLYLALAEGR